MFIFKLSPVSFRFFFYIGVGGSVYALKELIAFFYDTAQRISQNNACISGT